MFTNWLTYRAVAEELDRILSGAVITACYTQQKNELILALDSAGEERFLQFSAEPRFAWLLLKPEAARARRNSLDLFDGLRGDRITSVRIAAGDRIMRLELDSGRALYAFLFPVRANLILADDAGAVIESFKQHAPPAAFQALAYDNALPAMHTDDLRDLPAEDGCMALLRGLRPWLAGALAAEVLHRAGLAPSAAADDVDAASRARLAASLHEILEESSRGEGHVYLADNRPLHAAPVMLRHVDADEHAALPLLDALFLFLRRHYSGSDFTDTRKRIMNVVDREHDRVRRTLEKLTPVETLRRQGDEYEKFGNLLMIHLYDQPEQPGRMTVADIFTDPRLVVTIPLKPRTTVLENAQRYFHKAQQTRASIVHVQDREADYRARERRLAAFRVLLENARSSQELKQLFKEHAALMDEIGLTPKGEEETPFPFRRFVVTGGFEVWAGKNSANNDLLTVRHSRPNDIWFHARGVGGSHVVLKVGSAGGDPSKEAIRQAASIAAYYSKHRNAKRVPVAYTEKKYVRKPKGASPGSVVIDREKVIMVDPALPHDE